ncbi:cora-domain-containing protein [Sodiomyces alkalinus F11]|uniref:Cora-domain-containing protein n=1 Tax=Sodiomyces alkalinus (strain CBS 110278 / VKM F-3762 / F11) TaxID=1314773 RepID=A0A3N2PS92_SODAK|nr:cora-domain-containing protein [Sodiomyces alkalinus F11]ROT37389.1 cora-domain-containing protein [Sodiomyces alkalinus F11]
MSGRNSFKPDEAQAVPPRPHIQSTTSAPTPSVSTADQQEPHNKKKRPGRKKKRSRRKSFAVLPEESQDEEPTGDTESPRPDFYLQGTNASSTSMDSEELLDHRDQQPLRPRRASTAALPNSFQPQLSSRSRVAQDHDDNSDGEAAEALDEYAPLLSRSPNRTATAPMSSSLKADMRIGGKPRASRRPSSKSTATRTLGLDVNYPPSVPGSPRMDASNGLDFTLGDVMIRDDLESQLGDLTHEGYHSDGVLSGTDAHMTASSPALSRRKTIALEAEADVCFPTEEPELTDEPLVETARRRPRRRRGVWPDLSILDEWSRMEQGRNEGRKVKRITEPQLVNGRLRNVHRGWMRTEEDVPYRFTYFNEEFQSTVHSQTISELVQAGGSFQELFVPEPRVLSDTSSEEDSGDEEPSPEGSTMHQPSMGGTSRGEASAMSTRQGSTANTQTTDSSGPHEAQPSYPRDSKRSSLGASGAPTPAGAKSPSRRTSPTGEPKRKAPRYGDRPVWWLDVLCPTEAEMKVLSKAFGIHPLSAEDIMVQEAREKVELFRHYYFVNYRSFNQNPNSEDYLEPVNMYVIVFREGVLSFHFSMTPHPANVRRRIRQLKDFVIVNSDWISYAIIDDITDVFGPLIQNIEDEVDDIDDAILQLHTSSDERIKDGLPYSEKRVEDGVTGESGGDMLRRVGDCRKRVMSLYRLLGNKADVIKGFAKRCNERWEVTPRSDIGLYLGDIQDHIVTMTSNLSHYEKILARSHANYLAQINIRMNERSEQTADVLGKLTVLGTIVLPMNIITGLWGMNVYVPGQEYETLTWFWCLTAGLLLFGLTCYLIAKSVYKIV